MTVAQAAIVSGSILEKVPVTVQLKAQWSHAWQTTPFLQAPEIETHAAPSISQARLVSNYGEIFWQERGAFSQFMASDWRQYFVRAQIHTQGRAISIFTGVITDTNYDVMGTRNAGPMGNQEFLARGVEYLFDKIYIIGAWVKPSDLVGAGEAGLIDSCPIFNRRQRHEDFIVGNRSTAGTNGVYVFSHTDGNLWSNLDILRYALYYYTPAGLPVRLSGQYQILASIFAQHRIEGMSLKQVIDSLIDRHRGLGWCLRYTESFIYLHIYSAFGDPIQLTPGQTVSGNTEQISLDVGKQIDVEQAIVRMQGNTQYDRVIIQGDRLETCFSVRVDNEGVSDNAALNCGMKRGWLKVLEDEYRSGITADNTNSEKCDEARRADKYEAVYQRYVFKPDWDGLAFQNESGGENDQPLALPKWANGEVKTADVAPLYLGDKTLLRQLPLRKDPSSLEFMEPLAFVVDRTIPYAENDPPQFIQLDTAADSSERPSCSLRILDDAPGLLLKGRVPHIMALNRLGATTLPTDHEPAYDYYDLIFTVAMSTDERLSLARAMRSSSRPRILYISAPQLKVQYVAPGTVIGVSPGHSLQRHTGGVIRNDFDRMQVLGALAAAWYGEERASISLTYNSLVKVAELGQYIRTVGDSFGRSPVGTVVTSQSWHIEKGRVTTKIETSWYELDVSNIVEMPGIGGPKGLARQVGFMKDDIRNLQRDNVVKKGRDVPGSGGGGGVGDGTITGHSHSGYFDGSFGTAVAQGR
jgi:hypothetical protein